MKNLETKESCYLASGWFNEEEESCRQDILEALNTCGISYFSPKDEVEVKTGASQEELRAAFDADVNFIKSCDFVVASTAGKDLGTLFEIGFAYAEHVPTIIYFRAPESVPVNLMLACSAYRVCKTKEELINTLNELKESKFSFDKPTTSIKGNIE